MKLPAAFRMVVVSCPACGRQNIVDVRKARAAGGPRCGSCAGVLPSRWPRALVGGLLTAAVVGASLGLVAWAAWTDASRARLTSRTAELIGLGRAAEAVPHLPPVPRTSSGDPLPRTGAPLVLARRVAAALAAPVLEVDADAAASPERVADAALAADRLVSEHADLLPEIVDLLDAPGRRLADRRRALEALAAASEKAAAARRADDLGAVAQAVRTLLAAMSSSSPEVHDDLERRGAELVNGATLQVARESLRAKKPKDAVSLLAQRAAALRPRARAAVARRDVEPPPADLQPSEALQLVRTALDGHDAAALAAAVQLRADETWPAPLAASLEEHVTAACRALASVDAARARAAPPAARAELLLEAMTCDEVLPRPFLAEARRAVAAARLAAARDGDDVAAAVDAWLPLPGAERSQALAVLACLAEMRGDAGLAIRAWSALDAAELAKSFDCRGSLGDPPLLPPPSLEYPLLPPPLSTGGT